MNPDQQTLAKPLRFCGEPVSSEQLALITQIVTHCSGLSRTELANTVCELLAWVRPNGKLKTVECRQFLEQLQVRTPLPLPTVRHKDRGKSKKIAFTALSAESGHCKALSKTFNR
jgi:hypothetical protein